MPQKALSMRKIREVLRLRYDLGLLQQEIARSCSICQASVHRYLERAWAAGLSWPLPEDCDDRRLNELLFPAEPTGERPPARAPLDFAEIHRQLQSHKHVTLQLLWKEYRQSQPEGYGYSRFCELFSQSCFDLSFWKTREQAERYNRDIAGGQTGGQRGAAALLEADPVVKTFNVTSSPTHNIAAGRAA